MLLFCPVTPKSIHDTLLQGIRPGIALVPTNASLGTETAEEKYKREKGEGISELKNTAGYL